MYNADMRRLYVWLALVALGAVLTVHASAQGSGVVLVAPVRGIINPVVAGYVDRVITQAEQVNATAVVLELDTPGGLDSAMRDIIKRILASRVPVVVYVYPPGGRAGSAGVYITYAAHLAAMSPNTNIGSAHPVAIGDQGQQQLSDEMKEKITNDAVAFIRSLAERRGRNVEWAERAVRQSINATEQEALREGVIDLVAPETASLLSAVDGAEVETASGRVVLRTRGAMVQRVEMNAVEAFLHAIADPNIAFILISIGSLGIIYELSNPGAVLPGVVGGICLLLGLFALGMLPVNFAGLALIAFAFILFLADLLTPTHGVLTVGGAIALVLGAMILFNTPEAEPWLGVSLQLILAVAIFISGFFLFAVAAMARAQRRKPATGREALLGSVGEARTRLEPYGMVHVDGELWTARAKNGPISEGERVQVVGMEGLRLVVDRAPKPN